MAGRPLAVAHVAALIQKEWVLNLAAGKLNYSAPTYMIAITWNLGRGAPSAWIKGMCSLPVLDRTLFLC